MSATATRKAQVTVYSTAWCPYCVMAKRLLEHKGVAFEEISVDADPSQRSRMLERSGGARTVPQIFIGTVHVGGYTELAALEASGRLDALLAGEG